MNKDEYIVEKTKYLQMFKNLEMYKKDYIQKLEKRNEMRIKRTAEYMVFMKDYNWYKNFFENQIRLYDFLIKQKKGIKRRPKNKL